MRRYTIKGAQRIIKDNGIRFVQAVGRGEAVAAPPPLLEMDAAVEPAFDPDSALLPTADRAALQDALGDLQACRSLLDALRQPPD